MTQPALPVLPPYSSNSSVTEELISLAKDMSEASRRGEDLGLSDDEVAFYDALEVNDSAVKVLGEPTFKKIARELDATIRNNVTVDWTERDAVRAKISVAVKRFLRADGGRDVDELVNLSFPQQA